MNPKVNKQLLYAKDYHLGKLCKRMLVLKQFLCAEVKLKFHCKRLNS